jgi:hypothetical protein
LQQDRDRAGACPGCHQSREKAHDPREEQNWTAEARRCFACAAVGREADNMAAAAREGGNLHGISYVAIYDPRG